MDSYSESTFIDSDEDEIFLGSRIPNNLCPAGAGSCESSPKTPIPKTSLTTSFETVAVSDQNSSEMQGTVFTECQAAADQVPHANVGQIEDLANSPAMKSWQGGSNEPASSAEKDLLLLALQQRFEKHKVDLPDLSDLNLDDTNAENDSYAVNFQDKSLEFVANCSMPRLRESHIDVSCHNDAIMMAPLELLAKRTENTQDLDSTTQFLELEKSCLTPSKPDGNCQESLPELPLDDCFTVSADADGGFLTTLTNLALIHSTLNRDSIALSPFPAAKIHSDYGLIPESGEISEEFPLLNGNSIEEQCSYKSPSGMNTTFEEIQLLEAFGAHYMVSAEKDLIKHGLENSVNVSLSKDQQDILDSFVEKNSSTKPSVMRDISKAFEPSTLSKMSSTVTDEMKSEIRSTLAEDFHFPKPLSTISGSHSKTKYRHENTPMKLGSPMVSPKTAAIGKSLGTKSGKFFGSSPAKSPLLKPRTKFFSGSPINNPSRENMKSRVNTPVSNLKMSADLKNIQSPIGHYIKDSPLPSLMARKHIPFSGLQKNNKFYIEKMEDQKASENIDFNNLALPPQKSYQSTSSLKKVTPSKTRLPLLSGKTKQLVSTPTPMVMKHTGRVKASDLPSDSPLSKMTTQINDSCLAEKTLDAEVSVVIAKEATKTSSIK